MPSVCAASRRDSTISALRPRLATTAVLTGDAVGREATSECFSRTIYVMNNGANRG